jgi:hypothetical protein
VVVAVPEGLPLAVTIALAYSMKKMMKVGHHQAFSSCSRPVPHGSCSHSLRVATPQLNSVFPAGSGQVNRVHDCSEHVIFSPRGPLAARGAL